MHGLCQRHGVIQLINWAGFQFSRPPNLLFIMLLKYSLVRQCRQLVHRCLTNTKETRRWLHGIRCSAQARPTSVITHQSFHRIFITSLRRSFNDQGNHQEISAPTGPHPCIPNQCLASRTDEIVRPVQTLQPHSVGL